MADVAPSGGAAAAPCAPPRPPPTPPAYRPAVRCRLLRRALRLRPLPPAASPPGASPSDPTAAVGLPNLGLSCWLNSILQLLYATFGSALANASIVCCQSRTGA